MILFTLHQKLPVIGTDLPGAVL